jgi:hypothetical protein
MLEVDKDGASEGHSKFFSKRMETAYKSKPIRELTYLNPADRDSKFLPTIGTRQKNTSWCHNTENCILNNNRFENLRTYIKVSFLGLLSTF